ncbi:Uncharacterized protein CLAVI_000097 [Candidatus Clavichlamydia salmonicola]|uniref:hypothetical protein n=1 Tax=Candidatus Clavichlamydia salmonicola TaxID=469812 RepID=UPI001891B2DA|nr:hypothetical protein [Candidatus Clavichlamydia salmonicola]MBF5050492.1 Uncharacterized protein [Candidatus Clavichlamydia salmonicola]
MRRHFLFIIILISSCLSLGLGAFIFNDYSFKSQNTLIQSFQLISKTPGDHIPPHFFIEMLGLYKSSKLTLRSFDKKAAEQILLNTHLFSEVSISLNIFGEPIIHYALRQPVAYAGNISNMAIDASGCFFPKAAFVSLKKLPFLYIGNPEIIAISEKLPPKIFAIFQDIVKLLLTIPLEYVDFSLLDQDGAFKEIHIKTRSGDFLRTTIFNYDKELLGYLFMRNTSSNSIPAASVFDLRIPNIALIINEN